MLLFDWKLQLDCWLERFVPGRISFRGEGKESPQARSCCPEKETAGVEACSNARN